MFFLLTNFKIRIMKVAQKKSRKSESYADKIARWKKLSREAREEGVRYGSYEAFAKGVGLRQT